MVHFTSIATAAALYHILLFHSAEAVYRVSEKIQFKKVSNVCSPHFGLMFCSFHLKNRVLQKIFNLQRHAKCPTSYL
jgi:hypothetical protein